MYNLRKFFVHEEPKDIKSLARQTLKGKWADAIVVSLIAWVLTTIPPLLVQNYTNNGVVSFITLAYSLVMNGAMNLGIATYFLKVFRGENAKASSLTDAFHYITRAASLYVIQMLIIYLWTMLFVVPGIIAAYKYSQAFFLLADDPDKAPMECMIESKYLMNGNKLAQFRLDISFIGWAVIAVLPASVLAMKEVPQDLYFYEDILEFFQNYTPNPLIQLAGVTKVFLNVYTHTAHACFYELNVGNLASDIDDEDPSDAMMNERLEQVFSMPYGFQRKKDEDNYAPGDVFGRFEGDSSDELPPEDGEIIDAEFSVKEDGETEDAAGEDKELTGSEETQTGDKENSDDEA